MPEFVRLRHCFHADESYQDKDTGKFHLIQVTENSRGYNVVESFDELDRAKLVASMMNATLGLTDEDVLDIRASSMRLSR